MALDIYFHHTPLEFTGDKTNKEDIKSYLKCIDNTAKNDLRQFTDKWKKKLENNWERSKINPYALTNYKEQYFVFVAEIRKILCINWDYKIHPFTDEILGYPQLVKTIDEVIANYSVPSDVCDAYFTKVNFLYKYFEDRGKMIDQWFAFVDKDDVDVLIDRCQRVIAAKDNLEKIGPELLPTQSGFFFGSTDYDKWYLDDVKDCLKKMKTYRKFFKDGITCYAIFSW